MPMRFAVLCHDHPFPHWDLLLEQGADCRTWRLLDDPAGPGPWRAEPLPPHRRLYLDYEGPVSGDRGTVHQWDAGSLVWLTATERHAAVLVRGQRWSGRLSLQLTPAGWQAAFNAPSSS
jgi:hypothetical protein